MSMNADVIVNGDGTNSRVVKAMNTGKYNFMIVSQE